MPLRAGLAPPNFPWGHSTAVPVLPRRKQRVCFLKESRTKGEAKSQRSLRYSLLTTHYSLLYPNRRTQIRDVAGFPKCIVRPSDRKVIVSSYSRFNTSTLVEGRKRKPSKNSKNCPSFS